MRGITRHCCDTMAAPNAAQAPRVIPPSVSINQYCAGGPSRMVNYYITKHCCVAKMELINYNTQKMPAIKIQFRLINYIYTPHQINLFNYNFFMRCIFVVNYICKISVCKMQKKPHLLLFQQLRSKSETGDSINAAQRSVTSQIYIFFVELLLF